MKKNKGKSNEKEELGTTFDLIPQRGYVGASRLGHSFEKMKKIN